jgi:tetratricopeptide (TPR) repeat protein
MPTSTMKVVACLLFAAIILSIPAGCGSKKKKSTGSTIGSLEKKADEEKSPDRKSTAYLRVARAKLKAGDRKGAIESGKKALQALPEEGEAGVLAPKFVDVAVFLGEIGEKAQAKTALKNAVAMADSIGDPVRKAGVFADAGAVYADRAKGVGDSKAAKAALDKAKEIAGEMEPRFKGDALAKVALGYVKGGLSDAASEMVEMLEETGRSLEDARAKAEALAAAANVRTQTGKKDVAEGLLAEAAKAAKEVERAESRANALLAVGQAAAACGDRKQGLSLLEDAYKAADKVGDPEQRAIVLAKVATAIDEMKKK